jgi:hypothetical protein
VYAGHAGVALALKARQPNVVVAPLMLACYGPDWLETAIRVLSLPVDAVFYSHSIPAVAVGALIAGVLYRLAFGARAGAGARAVALGWLLHWPADYLTGIKPLLAADQMVGIRLYEHPWADLLLESVVLAGAFLVFRRVFGTSSPRRRIIVTMIVGLLLAQAALDYFFARQSGWGFALAQPPRRPHLSMLA